MPYTITHNPDLHIIEIRYQGDLVLQELREMFSDAAQLVKKHECPFFLSNFLEVTMKLSTAEIYEIPNILSDTFTASGLSIHKIKRALVVSKDLKEFGFFEIVTSNRGQNVKIFDNIAEAKEWLSKLKDSQ